MEKEGNSAMEPPGASSGSNNSKMSNTVEKTEKTPSRIEIYGEYILLAVYYNV